MDTKAINNLGKLGDVHGKKTEQSEAVKKRLAELKEKRESVAANRSKVGNDYGVNVSKQARDMVEARKKAQMIAASTSPVREDRVAELRRQIQSGSYKPDAGKIADGMLQEAARDKLALDMHQEAKKR